MAPQSGARLITNITSGRGTAPMVESMSSVDRGGADRRRQGGRGRRRRPVEYPETLYGQRQSYDGMVRTVADMVDAGARINILVLKSDDLPGILRDWTPSRYKLEVKTLGAKTVLDLTKLDRAEESDIASIRVAIAEMAEHPGHYCAVSDCKSAEFKGVFAAFIARHSPEISRLYLTNEDMKAVLASIESLGYDISIKYGSAKGSERATGAPKWDATITTMPFADFFAELEEDAKAATTVRYEAVPNDSGELGIQSGKARGSIARDCRFSASSNAEVLFKTAIPEALRLPIERDRRIDASAASAGSGAVEPTVIRFGRKIFDDKGKNQHYVKMIAKMPDSSISTYHVNPHIHLSLVDYTDGSSYDIWVLKSDRLAIIPQIRAGGASLRRLVNHILVHMGEGRVEKYEP